MLIKRCLDLDVPAGQSCFLWGARKTGKSTFLKERFPNALYIDLLQADVFRKYMAAPERLREELAAIPEPPLVILDEVQKVPALLDEVHWLIENRGHTFILCGSSARRLKSGGANLLGGRAWRYMFLPLCYAETRCLDWTRIFNHGLIPSHYLSERPRKHLEAYLYDYVQSEVQLEARLRNRDHFSKFLDILGFCNGTMIKYANIASKCGIDAKTVRSWFEILEDMYLGWFLRPYVAGGSRQDISATAKFYLFDTGVAGYLKRYSFNEFRGADAGQAFEHYLFLELTAYRQLRGHRSAINYWRTKDGREVDFIFAGNAIETKMSDNIGKKDLKGLAAFANVSPGMNLHVVCLENRKRVTTVNGVEVAVWPVEMFLQALWNGDLD